MLEDTSFADVVSWGPQGDCFVVKDMNEFTKSILPRMFKHSSFASFVRQLNKYDFHKVRSRFPSWSRFPFAPLTPVPSPSCCVRALFLRARTAPRVLPRFPALDLVSRVS